ncbi:hypothetical protein IEQ34_013426 [Dendrobium chrysotoxum]|uniref:Uncharacterized protein n=1 Tax=Dendrobium chrysotoxum TaxID=161865 RepID=A0AAV7GNK4_DENCH|nr:hypothetical protein IEQ34_013426 [Dendrobium chrysotoxum]
MSSALVASSRSKIFGCFIMARAIATLCFCPPDIDMNLWAFANSAAAIISVSFVVPSFPYAIFLYDRNLSKG